MKTTGTSRSNQAFNRRELMLLLGAIFLLIAVGIPWLKKSQYKSKVLHCQRNLSVIHNALISNLDVKSQRFPWQARDAVRTADIWFYMTQISNDLPSPKVLVCPADTRKPAIDWSTNITGLAHPRNKDNAEVIF